MICVKQKVNFKLIQRYNGSFSISYKCSSCFNLNSEFFQIFQPRNALAPLACNFHLNQLLRINLFLHRKEKTCSFWLNRLLLSSYHLVFRYLILRKFYSGHLPWVTGEVTVELKNWRLFIYTRISGGNYFSLNIFNLNELCHEFR